jgi:putative PIN family toxin of toxin-antitoxin system
MKRVVLDTNVLVASAYNPASASRRTVDACRAGQLTMVVSPSVEQEYEYILPRAIRNRDELERTFELIGNAERVVPASVPRVVEDDATDDKFLAAAVAGRADAIVTNDRRVLDVHPYRGIDIVRPAGFIKHAALVDGQESP